MDARRPITTIKQQVYEIIKDDICNGVYTPGQRIEEVRLAENLQVSRSPIREALKQLVSDRLLVEYPNRGVFVRKYTPMDIEEIFDLRILLEDYALTRSVQNMTHAKAQELTNCQERMRLFHKQNDHEGYVKEDTRLHQFFIELGGNTLIVDTYDRVSSMIGQFRSYALKSQKRFDESLKEHTDMIQYILDGNPEMAIQINRTHLKLAKDSIIAFLQDMDQE